MARRTGGARPRQCPPQRHGPPARPQRRRKETGMKDALGDVQSVLVLGGTSDIALATVRKLVARRSARVVLAARKPEACDGVSAELRAAGASSVAAVAFDATDFGAHETFIRSTFDRFGDFDLVLIAFGVLGDQARAEHD